ncbi:hypothetical protein ES703_119728 [subsurface metagenome]|jgi:hypothetical protein
MRNKLLGITILDFRGSASGMHRELGQSQITKITPEEVKEWQP